MLTPVIFSSISTSSCVSGAVRERRERARLPCSPTGASHGKVRRQAVKKVGNSRVKIEAELKK